jgi:hypothetical protein
MKVRIFIGFLAIAIFCLVSLKSQATMVMKLSEEEMANQAGSIVTGTVTSIESKWDEDNKKIYTYITVSPNNVIKGEGVSQEIVIKQPGGQVGDIVMEVHGISVFEEGENVFLFLKEGRKGLHRTIGLSQGKFSIETDSATQRQILIKKKAKRIRTVDGKIGTKIMAIRSDQKIFLDDFTTKIRNILQKDNK